MSTDIPVSCRKLKAPPPYVHVFSSTPSKHGHPKLQFRSPHIRVNTAALELRHAQHYFILERFMYLVSGGTASVDPIIGTKMLLKCILIPEQIIAVAIVHGQ